MAKGKARRRKNQNKGGEHSNPPPQEEIGGGREMVIIDTDLLDCSICTYPLSPPLQQCRNGHVACCSCWSKVQYKCHVCTLSVYFNNIALEKVLESVHIPCTYANLGCFKSVPYSLSQVHTDTCKFGPSSCPIPGCAYKAFSGEWQGHFLKDHRDVIQEYLQPEKQLTRLCTGNDGFAQWIRDYAEECGEMPEQLADSYRRSMELGRELQNMSIASTDSNPPPQEETGGRKIVIIDTNLLDCSICTNPLCPPLHQCPDNHVVACHSCWSILYKGHHYTRFGLSRNIALEKVLESVHFSCTYANLGCRKSVSYSQRQVHADTCEYSRSTCPIPGCAHKAFLGEWRDHFLKDHWDKGSNYSYGRSIYMLFNEKELQEDLYFTLLGPDKDLFLFVNEPILNVGNVLSLCYIDLLHQEHNAFSFELTVYGRYNTTTMQLKLPVISMKKWKRGEVGASSLFVPLEFPAFQNDFQNMKVRVLINKELDVDEDDIF